MRVYRSDDPFDAAGLPSVLATLGPDENTYLDDTAVGGEQYWYAVASVLTGAPDVVAVTRAIVSPLGEVSEPAPPPPPPATPEVQSFATSFYASGSNNAVNMPAGAVAGDLVLVLVRGSGTAGIEPVSANGWSSSPRNAAQTTVRSRLFWKVFTGTDDELSLNSLLTAIAYRITGATVVEWVASNSGTQPDPAALSTVGMVGERLWFAAGMTANTRSWSAPAGYPAPQVAESWVAGTYITNSAGSEDPAAFSIGANNNNNAYTIAVGNAA